jgi:hypothetical protein
MYRGVLIVRAESEKDARQIAMQTLIIGAAYRSGDETTFCPWNIQDLVSCEISLDSGFPVDGRREVLFPPEWDTEFQYSLKYSSE